MNHYVSETYVILELPAKDMRRLKDIHSEQGALILLSIIAPVLGLMVLSMFLGRRFEIDAMALFFGLCIGGFFLSSFVMVAWDIWGPKKKNPKVSRREKEKEKILLRNGWDGKTPYRIKTGK